MAGRPMTAQERIDAKTLAIEDPARIQGSGFIQFPPQRPFERPLTVQPATIATKEYEDLERARSGSGGGRGQQYSGGAPSYGAGSRGRGRGGTPHPGGGYSAAPNGVTGQQNTGGAYRGGGGPQQGPPARHDGGGRGQYKGRGGGYSGGGRGGGGRGYGRGPPPAGAPAANGVSHAAPPHAVHQPAVHQQGPPQHSGPAYSQPRSAPAHVEAVATQLKQAVIQDNRADGDGSKLSKAQRQRLRKKMRETGQD